MVENTRTYIYRAGDVVFLTDLQTKDQTTSSRYMNSNSRDSNINNETRHPYLLLSDVTNDTYEGVCMGMSTCRHKDISNVIPLNCPGNKVGYIIPNQVFKYSRDMLISDGRFAFSIDYTFALKLREYYLIMIGMSKNYEVKSEIYSMFVDVIHNGEAITHSAHSIGYRIPGESSPNPLNTKGISKEIYKELTIPSPSQSPRLITNAENKRNEIHQEQSEWVIGDFGPLTNWTDDQIRFVHSALQIRGGKVKIAKLLNVSQSTVYRRLDLIASEFNKRELAYLPSIKWENNPFTKKEESKNITNESISTDSSNVKNETDTIAPNSNVQNEISEIPRNFTNKTKYDVKFWEVSDLIRYRHLYKMHSYKIIKTQLGLSKTKQKSVYSSVITRLSALGIR